jgi:hypothetical protein
VAHVSPLQLFDLDLVRGVDGHEEVWAVGERSTLLRFRLPDTGPVPEHTPTPLLPPAKLHPTPTPFAVLSEAAALRRVRELIDPQVSGDFRIESIELMSHSSFRQHLLRETLQYWEGGYFSEYYGELFWGCPADGSRSVWLARVASSPICDAHLEVALDGMGEDDHWVSCFPAKVAELYLPMLLQYLPRDAGRPTPTPTVTPATRQLTPVPVDSLLGPCPTRTPYPTSVFPGYPGPDDGASAREAKR